jgi:hypothetical protein
MKLYATTTSERASKGQGGNKFIKSVITADEEVILNAIVEDYNEDEWQTIITTPDGQQIFTSPKQIKGKQQKGDN